LQRDRSGDGRGEIEAAAKDPHTAMERVGNRTLTDFANELAGKAKRVRIEKENTTIIEGAGKKG
jgi:hypothetical protein